MSEFSELFILSESISQVVLLTISILSFPLYNLEISIILRNRSTCFRGPFYRIMLTGMMFDIISVFNIFICQVAPGHSWLTFLFSWDGGNILGKCFYTITYCGRCIQGCTAMLLSFNRISAVCFPIFYRKFTESSMSFLMQIVQISGGILAIVLLLPKDYVYRFENDGYYAGSDDQQFWEWFYIFVAAMEVLFVTSIVVFNVGMLVSYHFTFQVNSQDRRNSVNHRISQEKQKQEQSMGKMTLIVCSFEIIYFIFVVNNLVLLPDMNKRSFYFYYNILGILYSTFPAWMLIIFSKPIRLFIIRYIKPKTITKATPFTTNEPVRHTNTEHRSSNF